MESKNTVMTEKQRSDTIGKAVMSLRENEDTLYTAQAQAEITWPIARKAGYDEALAQLAEMTEECKQMGRREVVEWLVEKNVNRDAVTPSKLLYGLVIRREEWRAKLKEWGV